jgi:hypothetical protein
MHPSRIETGQPLYDPLGAWPGVRRWAWLFLAVVVSVTQGPSFVRQLRADPNVGNDFFQEWASARNYREGLPIYLDLRDSVQRYLGAGDVQMTVPVNAHPPTSVLVALPFAALDYPDAHLAWNLAMLASFVLCVGLVWHELRIPFTAWSLAPALALTLLCNPFRQQITLGQLNLFLLPLLVGFWLAERRGRPGWAGIALGVATAYKLFPGLLFVYLLLSRQWRALAAGVLSFAAVTALTAAVLGTETYRTYVVEVLPQVERSQSGWGNLTLTGLWTKLFNPGENRDRIEPLWREPLLARAGALTSSAVILGVLAWFILKARSRAERDVAFGLTLTAMLLVSPIAWDHYLLLLLVPLAVTWTHLPRAPAYEMVFLGVVGAFWISPLLVYRPFIPNPIGTDIPPGAVFGPAQPWQTLLVLSFQCWAVLGFFALQVALFRGGAQNETYGANGTCETHASQ